MERTIRAFIENEPEVMMRITALLKRKGFNMRKIVMEADDLHAGAWLNITLADGVMGFDKAMNTVTGVIDVHKVEEI